MVDYSGILSSSYFTFVIGKEQKAVVVQADLFKDVSDVLHNKIHSDMKEGVEKRSELEDVEWEIFIGLCEYAYTRDYVFTLPTRSTLEEDWLSVGFGEMSIEKVGSLGGSDTSCSNCGYSERIRRRSGHAHQWTVCPSCEHINPTAVDIARCSKFRAFNSRLSDVASSKSGHQEFDLRVATSKTLCFHAKLAVLAQRYLIEPLKELCIANLYSMLLHYKLKKANTNDILDLLYYVYNEDGVDDVLELREMTLLFAVAKIATLQQDERLKLMMIENGQLGADLVYELSEQVP